MMQEAGYRVEPIVGYRTYVLSSNGMGNRFESAFLQSPAKLDIGLYKASHVGAKSKCQGLATESCICGWYALKANRPIVVADTIVLVVECNFYGKVVEHERVLRIRSILPLKGGPALSVSFTPAYYRAEYYEPVSCTVFYNPVLYDAHATKGYIKDLIPRSLEIADIRQMTDSGLGFTKRIRVDSLEQCEETHMGVNTVTCFIEAKLTGLAKCTVSGCTKTKRFSLNRDDYNAKIACWDGYDDQ